MSISTYQDEKTGETLFRVRIKRKSDTRPGVGVDKKLHGFKTQAEAEKAQMKLMIQVERELLVAESKSELWGQMIEEWEVTAKKGDIFIRDISRSTIEDYTHLLRLHTKDWMKLHVDEIDRAKAWILLDRIEREVSVIRRKKVRTAVDAIFKWAIISGRLKGVTDVPTSGFTSTRKIEDKMPEILNLEQIRTLLAYAHRMEHP